MKCKRRVFDPSVCLVPLISAHCVNISRAWNLFENLVAFGDCLFIKLLTGVNCRGCRAGKHGRRGGKGTAGA